MPVESADDLASMFGAAEFAEAASYTSPALDAVAVPCLVIMDRGQGRDQFSAGDSSAVTSERRLWVRQTIDGEGGLVEVRRDGRFAILDGEGDPTGEVLKAVGMPALDHIGHLWSVDLVIVN